MIGVFEQDVVTKIRGQKQRPRQADYLCNEEVACHAFVARRLVVIYRILVHLTCIRRARNRRVLRVRALESTYYQICYFLLFDSSQLNNTVTGPRGDSEWLKAWKIPSYEHRPERCSGRAYILGPHFVYCIFGISSLGIRRFCTWKHKCTGTG